MDWKNDWKNRAIEMEVRRIARLSLRERLCELLNNTGVREPGIYAKLETISEEQIRDWMKALSDQITGFEKESDRKRRLAEIDTTLKALKLVENALLADQDKVQAEQELGSTK